MSKTFLKLPMQFFAEESAPAAEPAGGTPAEPAKAFTQEDVNAIAARESKSAVEKLLKEAGIASEGDYKAALTAFKTWQDSQKTELEKAAGALSVTEKAKQEAEAKAALLERKFEAVAKGIPADKTDKYIKLAEAYTDDKTDFAKALELALKDFPVAEKGTPGAGGNPPPTPQTKSPLPKGTVIF